MRVSWDQLQGWLRSLEAKYALKTISGDEYLKQWDEIIELAGWTPKQFADEVDKRWETGKDHEVPLAQC